MHVHIQTHTHAYTYTHTHIYIHTHSHTHTHTHAHIYTSTHTHTYTCTHPIHRYAYNPLEDLEKFNGKKANTGGYNFYAIITESPLPKQTKGGNKEFYVHLRVLDKSWAASEQTAVRGQEVPHTWIDISIDR
jgi:hypothetical protein